MSKVLWHVTLSLDGFIAPRDNSAEWMFEYGSAGPMGREVMERAGVILAGRRGFDLGIRAGAGPRAIYGGAWLGPVFVLTHRPGETVGDVTFCLAAPRRPSPRPRTQQAPRTSGYSALTSRRGASAPDS